MLANKSRDPSILSGFRFLFRLWAYRGLCSSKRWSAGSGSSALLYLMSTRALSGLLDMLAGNFIGSVLAVGRASCKQANARPVMVQFNSGPLTFAFLAEDEKHVNGTESRETGFESFVP